MSVIAIQAEAAPYRYRAPEELARSLPPFAPRPPRVAELRRVVGVLRADGAAEDQRPLPTLERLDELVGNVEAAGLMVTVEVTGTPEPPPAGVELSATGSCRRRSATPHATRQAPPCGWRSATGQMR